MANQFVDFLTNCKTRKTNEMTGAKTMANQKNIGKAFSPEQAGSKIVGSLANLSPEALNKLLVFIDFLHFREATIDGLGKNIVKSENVDYDISEFSGMLSDYTPEEVPRFDDSGKRKRDGGETEMSIDGKIEFAKSIKGKYKNCNTNSKLFASMKRREVELEERKFKRE